MELGTMANGEPAVIGTFEIRLEGEFDLAEDDRLRDAFAVSQSSPIVVVNLEKTTYIDSTVLGCLVGLRNATEQRGASLFLVGPHSDVLRLFEISGLREIFDIRTSLSKVPHVDIAELRRLTIEARPPRLHVETREPRLNGATKYIDC